MVYSLEISKVLLEKPSRKMFIHGSFVTLVLSEKKKKSLTIFHLTFMGWGWGMALLHYIQSIHYLV